MNPPSYAPGPFSSFSGQDLNALSYGEPPDVAADVSPTQDVEFVNYLGMYVYDKPTLPIGSPAPTPVAKFDPVSFWCGSNGVNGQPLLGCNNGMEALNQITDTQIGYDAPLGRWLAAELVRDSSDGLGYVYFAATPGSVANPSQGWEKWSDDACLVDPTYPKSDQPLLGWSSGAVVLDNTCFYTTSTGSTMFGRDELHIIPNSVITSPATSLPLAIPAPCQKMAPARDVTGWFSSVYLLASIVPTTSNQPNCAPSSSNTEPYIVEYTATSSGVQGIGGCAAGTTGCSPASVSPEVGNPGFYLVAPNAKQLGCSSPDCQIFLGDARITAAQIRPVAGLEQNPATLDPVLTTSFATGINVPGSTDEAQDLWFVQDLSVGDWLNEFVLAGGGYWFAYPTIAVDGDLDFYLGSTMFTAGIYPSTLWDSFLGLSGAATFIAQNILESSATMYTGIEGSGASRWGDYNTMVFDPNAYPSGSQGAFWQVEETSQGTSGADESTNWEALADRPSPYFVGYSGGESECTVSLGQDCTVHLPTPSGLQNGDVVIATLDMGGNFKKPPTPPDSSWTTLTIANLSGANYMIVGDCSSGTLATGYVYAHVYGSSSETGEYNFKHVRETYCNGEAAPEIEGKLFGYRQVNVSGYVLYGYPNAGASIVSVGPAPSGAPSAGTLLNIYDGGLETESSEPGISYGSYLSTFPYAAPFATEETPADPVEPGYLLADLFLPQGAPIEQYNAGVDNGPIGEFGWQLFLPE